MIDPTTKGSVGRAATPATWRRHAFAAACVLWAVQFAVVMFVDVLPYLTAVLEYTPS